jgi:hypothetical protein
MRVVVGVTGAGVVAVPVTCGELVVGALGVALVVGGAEGLKKLCNGVSGVAPALASAGKPHLYTRNSSFSPSSRATMIMPSVGLFMIDGGKDAMISSVASPTRNKAHCRDFGLTI